MEEIAKLFVCADKDNAVPFRRIYLRDELCWTDAPNYLLVVMSGNIPLLKMFEEKDREMTEDNMEYWEYICYMDQTPGARKILQHSPGNNSRRILYSEHSHSGDSVRQSGNAGLLHRPL